MAQFHTLKILDDTIGLCRISQERTVSGFDLFTDSDASAQEVCSLSLSRPSPVYSEICSRAFSCAARPIGETPGALLFSDGVTLAEFCENAFISVGKRHSATALIPLLSAFHAVWILLKELECTDFTLQEFRPCEIIQQKVGSRFVWQLLPTPNIIPFNGSETCRRKFMRWLGTLPLTFPLTVQVLDQIASIPKWNAWQNAALENAALWTPYVPFPPFHTLKVNRSGSLLTLNWEIQEYQPDPTSKTNTGTAAAVGTLHLFEIQPRKYFPKNFPLLPADILPEFCGREFPLRSDENSIQLTLNGTEPIRLCGVRILGGWARPGRIFRAGGPEDVTFFDIYQDEDSLVLDLEWPDHIERALISASPKQFPSGPQQNPVPGSGTRHWFHDRFNPLIPKRIPLSEFKGWEQIFLRVFSIAESQGETVFSLGQASQSRRRITFPNQ